jgi:hypothetical protein
MKLKLSRKSIYVGTIVAMLAMVAGIALAASPFGSITSTGGSNGYSGTVSGTIWAGTVTVTSVVPGAAEAPCSASGAGTSVTPSSVGQTVNLYYYGSGAGVCAANDLYEEFVFTPTAAVTGSGAGQLDTFTIYSDVPTAYVQVPLTVTSSGSNTITHLDIWVDYTIGGISTVPGSVGVLVQGA